MHRLPGRLPPLRPSEPPLQLPLSSEAPLRRFLQVFPLLLAIRRLLEFLAALGAKVDLLLVLEHSQAHQKVLFGS